MATGSTTCLARALLPSTPIQLHTRSSETYETMEQRVGLSLLGLELGLLCKATVLPTILTQSTVRSAMETAAVHSFVTLLLILLPSCTSHPAHTSSPNQSFSTT